MAVRAVVQAGCVQVGGHRMTYQRTGAGPALLLVHGLVGSAQNWEGNLESLARHATVYAVDLMNMGASDRVQGLPSGLEAEADRLVEFLDALGIAAADIAGHSHGGAVAMVLAARHPARVRRLILFAPANPYCELGRGLIRFYNSPLGTWFARRIPSMPRLAKHVAISRMYGDPRKVTRRVLDVYVGQLNRESIDHVLSIVRHWWDDMAVLRGLLGRVAETPALLIWGDRDGAVALSSGRRLAEKLGAQLLVVPGVGHIPFQEQPEFCNVAVGRWLGTAALRQIAP